VGIERVPIGWIRAGERRHLNRRTIPFPVEESVKFSIVKLSQNYCYGLTATVPIDTYPSAEHGSRRLSRSPQAGSRKASTPGASLIF